MSNVAEESLVGSKLGDKYAIEALIGEGAMGSVYRAHQISLHRTVAIKVLHGKLADQSTFVERFQREAFSASRLDHPNSLRVLDFGQSDGLLYLVMEYAEGEDLLAVMERDWPFDDRRIVDIMSQSLAALASAHDLGIVHRDLKPENILLLRGTDDEGKPIDVVKVCDFGIAKLLGAPNEKSPSFSRHLTTEGFVVGTPDYMSPEQARGEDVDGRADLYSIGVVLYQLLVGELPFTAETPLGVVLRHISDLPPPPSSHAKVHARLEAICMRALSKNPQDRFENAREMRRALRSALAGSDELVTVKPAPMSHSTDMTSVPISLPKPEGAPDSRLWRRMRSVRFPATTRGRLAVLVAAVIGSAGLSLAMQYAPKQTMVGQSVITESTVAPNRAPAAAAEQPMKAASPPSDDPPKSSSAERAQGGSGGRRAEQATGRVNASPSPAGAVAIGTRANGIPEAIAPPTASPRSVVRQSSPVAPFDAVPALGPSATSESALPAAPGPPPPISAPPAQSTKPAPPAADQNAPNVPSSIDPARASVTIGAITTTGGISASKVRVALARIPFTSCYRTALANRASAGPSEASLRITLDVGGRVAGATLSSDGNLPGLRPCIESEARSLSIRDVDTGDGSAVVNLAFSPR